jgi:hypothetical protein
VIEPAELTLISLLQSIPCVYYRSNVGHAGEVSTVDLGDLEEERSVGFRVRDETGTIRVFPRGARVDAPMRLDESTGTMGYEPAGLAIRTGPAIQAAEPDRATAIAQLLQVHDPATGWRQAIPVGGDRRWRYREARLEPGDAVTIVGRALPFSDLADPANADVGTEADLRPDDPEVAADVAEARAAGILTLDPATAWGNAAIAGFGIGRPVSSPQMDPGANPLPTATADEAARIERTFEIDPAALVLASSAEVPLLIAYGTPGAVVQRTQLTLIVGLLGAVLAIASAMVFAVMVGGVLGS